LISLPSKRQTFPDKNPCFQGQPSILSGTYNMYNIYNNGFSHKFKKTKQMKECERCKVKENVGGVSRKIFLG
jgi:hypothetical protein